MTKFKAEVQTELDYISIPDIWDIWTLYYNFQPINDTFEQIPWNGSIVQIGHLSWRTIYVSFHSIYTAYLLMLTANSKKAWTDLEMTNAPLNSSRRTSRRGVKIFPEFVSQ